MARPPAVEQVQVNFRMPAELKARIEAAAAENNRSTTAEIVATLEEKYPAPEPLLLFDVEKWRARVDAASARSAEIIDRMGAIVAALKEAKTAEQFQSLSDEFDALQVEHDQLFSFTIEDPEFHEHT